MEYFLIQDIFSKSDFRWLSKICKDKSNFKEFSLGDTSMFIKDVPFNYNQILNKSLENVTKKRYLDLYSFVRLNSSEKDYSVRIHSDAKICNQLPDTACVFYLDTLPDSGTALFEHPVYGRFSKHPSIYKNQDDWSIYYKCNSLANSMFVYPANYFHGRFPWRVNAERVIIAKFLKTIS